MISRPLISFVVPTRDRPDYVRYMLKSITMQKFNDMEVIIVDNPTTYPCKAVFDRYADHRFRYVRPDHPLGMCDNWEFAVDQAKGDYVCFGIDKTALRLGALDALAKGIAKFPAEIYSWQSDAYYLTNEAFGDTGTGYFVQASGPNSAPSYVDLQTEIMRKLAFQEHLGAAGKAYTWGKICFGSFSKKIIEKIRLGNGRLFPLLSPDYSSMCLAMQLKASICDLGIPLQIHLNTIVGNGTKVLRSATSSIDFIRSVDPTLKVIQDLPIPGVYASVHNMVAYDYRFIVDKTIGRDIHYGNLVERVWGDLNAIERWASDEERAEQYGALFKAIGNLSPQYRDKLNLKTLTMPPPPEPAHQEFLKPDRKSWWENSFTDRIRGRIEKLRNIELPAISHHRDVIEAIVRRGTQRLAL